MAILKVLTEGSYIVEMLDGEKMGILIDYNEGITEKTGVEFLSKDGKFEFESITELEQLLGVEFKYEQLEEKDDNVSSKFIGEYPINDTDTIVDVQYDDPLGIGTFRKSTRSKKRFYPGYWIVKAESGTYNPRLTISVDIYEERKDTDLLRGPYKSFMEVTFELKKL